MIDFTIIIYNSLAYRAVGVHGILNRSSYLEGSGLHRTLNTKAHV